MQNTELFIQLLQEREDMPTQRSREEVGAYTLRGIIDFIAFATDKKGTWYEINTENASEWKYIPTELEGSLGGAFIVAIKMLERVKAKEVKKGKYLQKVTDESKESFLATAFGDS